MAVRTARSQTPASPLSFEVASVKPASAPIATKDDYSAGFSAGMRAALAERGLRIAGKRVNISDNSLKDPVRLAYEVKEYQITAPARMASEKYDIVANMPAGGNQSQVPEMLRTLLETRFHVQLHRETKKMPVYAVVVAKGGPKLTAAGSANAPGGSLSQTKAPAQTEPSVRQEKAAYYVLEPGTRRVLAKNSTMAAFADQLTRRLDRPAIDASGLKERYDFDMSYSTDLNAALPEAAPSLSTALLALGLKLEKRDVPMEILAIERADKVPVEN